MLFSPPSHAIGCRWALGKLRSYVVARETKARGRRIEELERVASTPADEVLLRFLKAQTFVKSIEWNLIEGDVTIKFKSGNRRERNDLLLAVAGMFAYAFDGTVFLGVGTFDHVHPEETTPNLRARVHMKVPYPGSKDAVRAPIRRRIGQGSAVEPTARPEFESSPVFDDLWSLLYRAERIAEMDRPTEFESLRVSMAKDEMMAVHERFTALLRVRP